MMARYINYVSQHRNLSWLDPLCHHGAGICGDGHTKGHNSSYTTQHPPDEVISLEKFDVVIRVYCWRPLKINKLHTKYIQLQLCLWIGPWWFLLVGLFYTTPGTHRYNQGGLKSHNIMLETDCYHLLLLLLVYVRVCVAFEHSSAQLWDGWIVGCWSGRCTWQRMCRVVYSCWIFSFWLS